MLPSASTAMIERVSVTWSEGISRTVGSWIRRTSRGFLNVVETMKKTNKMKRMSIIGTIGTSARLRWWR